LHPHLDVVCPRGPAFVRPWEVVRRHRALMLHVELRIPVARGKSPYAPDCVDPSTARRGSGYQNGGSRVPSIRASCRAGRRRIMWCWWFWFSSRPSVVKQRIHAKRPTWQLAQAGRVIPLRDPGLWSHSRECVLHSRILHQYCASAVHSRTCRSCFRHQRRRSLVRTRRRWRRRVVRSNARPVGASRTVV